MREAMRKIIIIILFANLLMASYVNYNLFTNYDPSSTSYVYNSAGSTDPKDGDVNTDQAKEANVFLNVSAIASASIDFSIECSTADLEFYQIYTKSFTATGKTMVRVVEHCYSIAVGVKVQTNAVGDNISVKLDVLK